jgi:hypothetical protein
MTDKQYNEIQSRLHKAQVAESESQWGSKERDEAHHEVIKAQQELYELENGPVEDTVTLLAPNSAFTGESVGLHFENGKAKAPRSVANNLVAEYPDYSIKGKAS